MKAEIRNMIDEVLTYDRSAPCGPWQAVVEACAGLMVRAVNGSGIAVMCKDSDVPAANLITHYRTSAPRLAQEVERLDADLAVARRLLPARYFDADGSILDPERGTPHAPDCAECGRGRAHDEGCLALRATPAEGAADREAENEYLRAELDRARDEVERLNAERAALLAPVEGVDLAEVLRLDGGATPGPWHPQRGAIRVDLPGPIEYTWALAAYPKDVALIAHYRTAAPALARAVVRLRAADAAHPSTPATAPE